MKNFASRTGLGVAVAAAAISGAFAFVPYGYPWPTVAWAALACVAVVWVAHTLTLPAPFMSDVIHDVEAEPSRAQAIAHSGVNPTRAVS